MEQLPSPAQPGNSTEPKLKIYFLPNLLTAGNLFCGFVALTKIVEADVANGDFGPIKVALGFILLACVFDLFDGRVARMGGVESPFGREFDSLADLISFGAAPAFLVHRVVLKDVIPGRLQLPQRSAGRKFEQGFSRFPDPLSSRPGFLFDAADHPTQ